MSSALGSIGSVLGGTAGNTGALGGLSSILKLGSTGYNLYNQYHQQQQQQQQMAYQKKIRDLVSDPTKMAAYAEGYTNPLNAGLTSSVANQAQAYLASRGLSSSPQISEQVEAQAIAPYIQQNNQQGYQDALQALGLGENTTPTTPGQGSTNSLGQIFSTLGSSQNPYQVLLNAQRPTGLSPTDPSLTTEIPTIPEVGMQDWYTSNVGV